MFWVGALFVVVPLVFAGTVLTVWWHGRRRERHGQGGVQAPGAHRT
jgi:hypothetical protein